MTELEYQRFAALQQLIDIGIKHQWRLTSQNRDNQTLCASYTPTKEITIELNWDSRHSCQLSGNTEHG